jgi:hypothetical protein
MTPTQQIKALLAARSSVDTGDALGDVGDTCHASTAQQNVYPSLVKIGPKPSAPSPAPEPARRGTTSDVSPPAQANPAAATPTPDTLEFETDAHRLADQLGRLHQDGVIPNRSAEDPEACFYASLLRSFDATYIGKIIPSAE